MIPQWQFEVNAMLVQSPGEEIPAGLECRLNEVERLVRKVEPMGRLKSTQVIAMVVEQYLREYPHDHP